MESAFLRTSKKQLVKMVQKKRVQKQMITDVICEEELSQSRRSCDFYTFRSYYRRTR